MSSLLALPPIWAQAGAGNPAAGDVPRWLRNTLLWLFLYGEPAFQTSGLLGGWLTWIKAISLLCFVSWIGSWLIKAIKEGYLGRGRWYDFVALAAALMIPVTVLVRTLEATKQLPVYVVGSVPLAALVTYLALLVLALWVEVGLWRTLRRFGRSPDIMVLLGIHLALVLGLAVGVLMQRFGFLPAMNPNQKTTWSDGLVYGARLSAIYMGYVILLRILMLFGRELFAVRGRRLYAIAQLSVHEANRKMWAPWVVVIVFALVLAFTHWFLQPPRAAEMGRLFVATLTLLCSLLLTAMVTILVPLSLPTDIQQQTISTVVCKPVRRLELIWGRMIGFMALVTVLVVVFGSISLA
ncbi:MAG: hypothetical protein JO114_02010, partial [Planctomycetaceae bacterium]|nr:hypothetical protein [Planctomycetaceae bacterium]